MAILTDSDEAESTVYRTGCTLGGIENILMDKASENDVKT